MSDNDKNIKPRERCAGDVNFSRHGIFASRNVRGYRVLPAIEDEIDGVKVMRQVSVGTYKKTEKSLDEDDELVYLALYGRWEKHGCNMEARKLTTALMNTAGPLLIGSNEQAKRRRMNVRDYEKLRFSLDKMVRIPIEFDNAYENDSGYSTETITLLTSLELFNRKDKWGEKGERGGKYFEFTTLELNEKVCRNIKAGKIKLIYLDQFASIRSETGRLIYKFLERLAGVIKLPFRREALEFARECTIDLGPNGKTLQPKEIIRKMRRACEELKGKILTCGVIGDCRIENVSNGDRTKWEFICPINKVITIRSKETKTGAQHVVPDRRDLDREKERIEDDKLMERFGALPTDQQQRILLRADEIHRVKHSNFGPKSFAMVEALREFFGLEALRDEIDKMTPPALMAREPETVAYVGRFQREAIGKLADVLRRYLNVKLCDTIQ